MNDPIGMNVADNQPEGEGEVEATDEQDWILTEKQSNEDRKKQALMKKAQRAHDWRVQVWAQSERRIRAFNAQLEVLGHEKFEPYEPAFDDNSMLEHYANMKLS